MTEISFWVQGLPPAKNEAKSMLAAGHCYADRVLALLHAARKALGEGPGPLFPDGPLALDVVLESPAEPPSDATNYLGGIADVLESKGHRGPLDHLGELASVAVYGNDRQIQEVHYRREPADQTRYHVRLSRR
ncbi:hypothetical protein [Micromonospora rifamycinica]|uniref:Uncharacterized protein n=1 Tax=Micromonospora rifamycinica TaxID=291594 RepID=A0A109IKY4_9ACTN|nr:hypothetical protein [Micromonospora rifamycinica]KWV32476.1 hypothetical protein AWV63_12075 [Micromonospora rifamycinica]SCG63240.1 hypothetical protein GA0070623_2975 [Micromonospora rifamycinica]